MFFLLNAVLVPLQGNMGLPGLKGEQGPGVSLPCAVLMSPVVLKHVEIILNASLNRKGTNVLSLIASFQRFVAIET